MVDELNNAITAYQEKWRQLLADCNSTTFFEQLLPTAVAWKTEDLADFDARLAELRDQADQIHLGWIDGRWLATIHLRETETPLANGLTIIKLMQRRPGSTDATGLDHLDFYFDPMQANAKEVLTQESNLKWSEENSGGRCKWLSIWFAGTEAKIRSNTVLDVCIDEMQEIRGHILAAKPATNPEKNAA